MEIDDAFEWYNKEALGLGVKFLDDFDRSVRRIISYPFSCEKIDHDIRRCLLSRFPFGIIYGIDNDTIVIMAVAHLHCYPSYWIDKE